MKQPHATIAEAVSSFRAALTAPDPKPALADIAKIDVESLVANENLPAFIHLLCHSMLLSQARHRQMDLEARLAAEIVQFENSHWFVPACLSLVELRYSNGTLNKITELEKKAIRLHYELDRLPERNHLKYYRSGTTSIIFVAGAIAIKIVRPIYLMDRDVASLDKYIMEYDEAPLSPDILWAEPAVLAMAWIRGETLEEIINAKDAGFTIESRLNIIRALGAMIGEIHSKSFPHGDLNPRNIIVESNVGGDQRLRLIDYGFNYSLTKPVLSAQSYRESVRYIAPSPDDTKRDAYLDDLYSLSVIILDVWFRDITSPAEELLHELSIVQPLLAFVIEDALVDNPALRLRKTAPNSNDHSDKAKKFASAIQVSCSEKTQNTRAADEKTSLFSVIRSDPLKFISVDDDSNFTLDVEINRRLTFYKRLSISTTALSASAILAVATESYSGSTRFFAGLRGWWHSTGYGFTLPDAGLWEILPGLAICLSFLLLATKYYLAIFCSIAPTADTTYGSRLADRTMRLNSFAYIIPISFCFLFDPKLWPFCSAVGLGIVALNNVATFRMLRKIRGVPTFNNLAISRSAEARTAYIVFAGWGSLVSWYALGIVMVGTVLLTSGSARNQTVDSLFGNSSTYNVYEYLLALCVIGINYFKMQRENCGRLAPKMRALIQRYIEASKVYDEK